MVSAPSEDFLSAPALRENIPLAMGEHLCRVLELPSGEQRGFICVGILRGVVAAGFGFLVAAASRLLRWIWR